MFLAWIAFCAMTAAVFKAVIALALVILVSVLALALRWVSRTFLQATPPKPMTQDLESVRPDSH